MPLYLGGSAEPDVTFLYCHSSDGTKVDIGSNICRAQLLQHIVELVALETLRKRNSTVC